MNEHYKIQIIQTQETAILPIRKSEQSPGYNLCSSEKVIIEPNSSIFVQTGWNIKLPNGTFGRIVSKNAYKHNFIVGNEVINSEIEFVLKIYLTNYQNKPLTINQGDSIGYLLIERVLPISLVQDIIFTAKLNNVTYCQKEKEQQRLAIQRLTPTLPTSYFNMQGKIVLPQDANLQDVIQIQDTIQTKCYFNDNTLNTIYSILGDSVDFNLQTKNTETQTYILTQDKESQTYVPYIENKKTLSQMRLIAYNSLSSSQQISCIFPLVYKKQVTSLMPLQGLFTASKDGSFASL